jgi:hypothetical protein
MVKRDKRNIGKIVQPAQTMPCGSWSPNERMKVVGFRGDHGHTVGGSQCPYVNVFRYRTGSVWPVAGCMLEYVGK